jgi:hypothetical protein
MTANIKLQVSINSGPQQQGPVSGGIAVASNDVIGLSGFNVSGAKRYRYEIFDYPPGFTTPSGWSQDSGTLAIYYEGPNPPSWEIPSDSQIWGKWGLSLIIDGGVRPDAAHNNAPINAPDLRDESIVLVKEGPLHDGLFKETNQVDQLRQHEGDYKRNLRIMGALVISAGGEANTASNVGTAGVGVVDGKDGTDLQFRNIAPGDLILVTLDGTNIVVAINRDALLDLINTGSVTIPPVGGDAVDGGDPLEDLRVIAVHSGGASGEQLTIDTMIDGQLVARAGSGLTTIDWIRRIVGDPNGVETGTGGEFALSTDGRAWINAGGTVWYEVSLFGLAGGDLDGNYPDPSVIALHMGGVRVALGPISEGQFLRLVNGVLIGSTFAGGGGSGASNGIPFTYDDSSTTMADPTPGKLRLSSGTLSAVTTIAFDHQDANTTNVEAWLDALNASQSAVKGRIRLASASDSTRWAEFDVVTVTNQSAGSGGWQQLTVVYVAGNGTLQTTAADTIVSFTRSGDPGSSGIPYTYDNSGTTSTDPGNGKIRFSSATVASITHLYADLLDANGRDVTAYLDTLDDSTSTVKGYVTLRRRTDPTAFALFQLTAVTTQTGYRDLTVVHINSGGTFVTTAADIFLQFSRTGDKGADGNVISVLGVQYTYSTTTTNSDPGNGNVRFNAAVSGASYSSVTAIYIDNLEGGGADVTGWFATWDDSTSTVKGQLVLQSNATPGKLVIFNVTAVSAQSGYYLITVSHVASNGPLPTTANDIRVFFTRTGDKGNNGADGADGAGGLTSVNAYDGVAASLASNVLTVRRSRVVFSPASFSTDQHDFNGGNSASFQDADEVELTPTANVDLTGMEACTSNGKSRKKLRNKSGTFTVTLKHINTGSAAANRFGCPGSTNCSLGYNNDELLVEYDFVGQGWRPVDRHVILASGAHTFKGNQSMGDNALLNCRTIELNNSVPGAAGTGQSRAHAFAGSGGKSPGWVNARPADGRMLIDQCVGYVEDSGTGTSRSGTLALDFSSMMGRDLSNGAFMIKVIITSRCVTDSTSYPYIAAEAWFFYPGKGMGVTYMKQQGSTTRAYWTPSATLSGSGQTTQATLDATKSGDTVNVAWAIAPGGAGSNTWETWIEARITGGAP